MKRIILLLIIVLAHTFAPITHAQEFWQNSEGVSCLVPVENLQQQTDPTQAGQTDYIVTINCVPILLGYLVKAAIMFGGVVALFVVIFGGFKILRSGGDSKMIDSGRNTIVYGIVGLVIVFMAYFILSVIGYVTGAECITKFQFTGCQEEQAP